MQESLATHPVWDSRKIGQTHGIRMCRVGNEGVAT